MRAIGRATQGVRLIDIEDDDRVVAVAKLDEKDAEAEPLAGVEAGVVPGAGSAAPDTAAGMTDTETASDDSDADEPKSGSDDGDGEDDV